MAHKAAPLVFPRNNHIQKKHFAPTKTTHSRRLPSILESKVYITQWFVVSAPLFFLFFLFSFFHVFPSFLFSFFFFFPFFLFFLVHLFPFFPCFVSLFLSFLVSFLFSVFPFFLFLSFFSIFSFSFSFLGCSHSDFFWAPLLHDFL